MTYVCRLAHHKLHTEDSTNSKWHLLPGGHQRSTLTLSSQGATTNEEPFSLVASISSSVLAAEDIPELDEHATGGVILTIGTVVVLVAVIDTPRKARGKRARVSNTPEGGRRLLVR